MNTVCAKFFCFQGSLIMFDSKPRNAVGETTVKMESWVKPIDHYAVIENVGPYQKIKVSSFFLY